MALKQRMIVRMAYICALVCAASTGSMYAMNLLRPYDTLLRPDRPKDGCFQGVFYAETDIDTRVFNTCGDRVDPLRYLVCEFDALAMLDGFAVDSPIGQKRIMVDANDNGVRGHLIPFCNVRMPFAGAYAARFFHDDHWEFSAYIPVYVMELRNVHFDDLTPNVDAQDKRVHEFLTDTLAQNVLELGGLDIGPWRRGGLGDIVLFLEWFSNYPQVKPFLRNVQLYFRGGVGLPTGKRVDEDKLLAFAFGSDGGVSVPFGGGLDLLFGRNVQGGVGIMLTHTFGSTRCRRIKTSVNQTEPLLLAKASAYKDFGLTQLFNIYLQFREILWGGAFKVAYQYVKHGDDELSLNTNEFSAGVANTAFALRQWTMHHIILDASYDFGVLMQDPVVTPRASLYLRLPFNGRRAILNGMIGGTISFEF
jgi:hypothetical protein